MRTCLGESFSFSLPCVPIVIVYQLVCGLRCLLVLRVGYGILMYYFRRIVYIIFYFTYRTCITYASPG